jgi:thiamine-phosphate pyrophosphorylase
MRNEIDYSLYLVTDRGLAGERALSQILRAAIRGGVSIVQYREKNTTFRQMLAEAGELYSICRAHHIPFIINDRVDLMLAVDADGVHVGQEDVPAIMARKLIGPNKILGVSVENVAQVQTALEEGADYVGASPVFTTPTKPDAPPALGLLGLQAVASACPLPVVAIGGINHTNASAVLNVGAAGLAVVSAIVAAPDVENATRGLRQVINLSRQKSGPG